MPDVHALLSASSSKQWLHCPPSVRLQENFPNESSVYAEEGTFAHEICEYKVRKYLHERVKRPQSEEFDTEEIEQITDVYAEFVISIIEQMRENGCEPLAFVEERVDYSHIAPSGFGTADMLIIGKDENGRGLLHVCDFKTGNNRILGYDCVDGKLVPNQDADAVRMIFQMYIEGKSIEEIRRLLTDYGIRTKKGQPLAHNNIMYILQNETYMGDKLLQKQPPKNFLTKKPDERAPYESNYLENDHEAIVDRKTWDTVQEIMRQKKAVTAAVGRIGGRPHFLYGKLFCGECGEPMTRRTLNGPKGIKHKVWTCRGRHEGRKGNGCKLRTVKEDLLLHTIEESIGCEVNAENAAQIQRVVITEDDITVETS